ncbi:hypothetical protein B0T16DRAFT_517812 [Cercophora newfieldiana]|uniref:CorA-like transporter domain-containing protein n=1 Tax=Cercophora newfieldiana TaxID=92897 RepID=A0AA39XRX2_9PEZI|nr:hypothetical protein B0T16DRAFT_517812 [Cercophora newfieldiana]
MRQMAVCHRADFRRRFCSWILVHPGQDIQDRFCARAGEHEADLAPSDELEARSVSAQLIILHFAAKNWAEYLRYLSSECKQLNDRALNSEVVNIKADGTDEFEINIQDMQQLQWLAQHLHIRCGHALESGTRLREDGRVHTSSPYRELSLWVAAWQDETRSNLYTLQTLAEHVSGCTQLVFNILKMKDDEVIQTHGRLTNTLAQHSHGHNSMLLHLAYESESTARSVRMITLITLLYLPPSFLAISRVQLTHWPTTGIMTIL